MKFALRDDLILEKISALWVLLIKTAYVKARTLVEKRSLELMERTKLASLSLVWTLETMCVDTNNILDVEEVGCCFN